MPDRRKHRGAHPRDATLFGDGALPTLRLAVDQLSWLLERGYSAQAALKLVGDRHALRQRQRVAVARAACAQPAADLRRARRLDDPRRGPLLLDGFNCLIIVESALGGAVVLRGRDGACRDLAGLHGSYRLVQETLPAIEHIGARLEQVGAPEVVWFLDRPISNSGRLGALLRQNARVRAWPWSVQVVNNPDRELIKDPDAIVATSDAWVLDHCGAWFDLVGQVLEQLCAGRREQQPVARPWVVDLG